MTHVYLLGVSCDQTQRLLESRGYRVQLVKSPDELVDCLQASPYVPGVIAEIERWDWAVFDLIALVLQLRPGSQVVLMTAKATISEVVFALRAGVAKVLQRPFESLNLAEVANEAFACLNSSMDPACS